MAPPITAVLGAGAWGTALALRLAETGDPVRLWAWPAPLADLLRRDRCNDTYLRGFPLPPSVEVFDDVRAAVRGASLVVVVVPSEAFRTTLTSIAAELDPGAAVVSATKGLEEGTLLLLSEVADEVLGVNSSKFAVLSGPSFADEVARGIPTNVLVAAHDQALRTALQERIARRNFRVYTSDDPVGVQMGGALKNVIAIAAGACDALGFGYNTRAGLITRGLAEMARMAVQKGGKPFTMAGLAGIGDLVLTCTGPLSRNRQVGVALGEGKPLDEILGGLGHVAEGVTTARTAYQLSQRHGVDLPICTEVYRVLHEGKKPAEAVRDILSRPLGEEGWW